jgi:hypothetical membrane protein
MNSLRTKGALLVCGIVSSLLYVAADVLAAMRYPDYHSFTSQAISELSAIGAPSRPLVLPILIAHSVLVIPFGMGVWQSAYRKRALRMTGSLLVALGVIDLVAPFFPMHMRGAEATLTDTMHIALTIVTVAVFLLGIGFAATAFGRGFRVYSLATVPVLLVFGAVGGMDAPRIAAQLPTPWLGLTERINIGGYLLWQAVLALALLRVRAPAGVESVPVTPGRAA